MKEFYVEFDFRATKYGMRCMQIQGGFKTEAEATEWAEANTSDGRVHWQTKIEF